MGVPERFWRVMVGTLLFAAVWIQFGYGPGVTAAQQRSNTSDRRPMVLDRAPARMIADPNPVFRAVVLDAEHGEVFMANDKESAGTRSEEHTSELQSRLHLVCRLLLEKKKKKTEKDNLSN